MGRCGTSTGTFFFSLWLITTKWCLTDSPVWGVLDAANRWVDLNCQTAVGSGTALGDNRPSGWHVGTKTQALNHPRCRNKRCSVDIAPRSSKAYSLRKNRTY